MIALRASTCGHRRRGWPSVTLFALCLIVGAACAATPGTALPSLRDDEQGPTCQYFNGAAKLDWPGEAAAVIDAGSPTSASGFFFAAGDGALFASFDATAVVERSRESGRQSVDLVLYNGGGGGTLELHSRESEELLMRPRLKLKTASGRSFELAPSADTFISCSTHASLGGQKRIKVGPSERAIVAFPIQQIAEPIERAELEIGVRKAYGRGEVLLGQLAGFDGGAEAAARFGIAAGHPEDVGLEGDPRVWLVERFSRDNWVGDWSYLSISSRAAHPVAQDPDLRFEALQGRALRIEIPADGNTGLDLRFGFRDKLGYEPEQAYMRYYLRLADDWHPDVDGGKLPGFAGTYGVAGWGQRRSDGQNGWSARGSFLAHPRGSDPRTTPTPIGTYAYHAGMSSDYSGDSWPWGHLRSLLENNRWYSIEQFVQLNTPGRKDGVVRAWVDGVQVFERTNVDFRHTDTLKIETVWMNVYHGGSRTPGKDLHLYIDNVVIASEYVGPMQTGDHQENLQ